MTTLSFHADVDTGVTIYASDAEDARMAVLAGSVERSQEFAESVVHAFNCHDALVAALQRAINMLDNIEAGGTYTSKEWHSEMDRFANTERLAMG